jgi:hypothetical protein
MLLLYPILFSFTHSLSHHLSAHQHQHVEHSKEITTVKIFGNKDLAKATKTCPICEYEFAPLLEPDNLPDQGKNIFHFIILPSLTISLYCEVLLNQFPARAPPSSPIYLLG